MAKNRSDYSKKTKQDLQKKVAEAQSHLQEMHFKLSANQLREVRKIREAKKEIARMMTAMKSAN